VVVHNGYVQPVNKNCCSIFLCVVKFVLLCIFRERRKSCSSVVWGQTETCGLHMSSGPWQVQPRHFASSRSAGCDWPEQTVCSQVLFCCFWLLLALKSLLAHDFPYGLHMQENLMLCLWECWQYFRNLPSCMEKLCVQEFLIWKALFFLNGWKHCFCLFHPIYSHEGVQHIIFAHRPYVRKLCMNAA
jgi:hypothetical protein